MPRLNDLSDECISCRSRFPRRLLRRTAVPEGTYVGMVLPLDQWIVYIE